MCAFTYIAGKHAALEGGAAAPPESPTGSTGCKPGPWGELAYTPFSIAAPDDLLPARAIEANGTHWFLKGYTTDGFAALLRSTSMDASQQQAWLTPAVLHSEAEGVDVTPPPEMVFSLPYDARGKIYEILARFILEDTEINVIAKETLEERFSASGVSPETVALFKRLCYARGNYLLFSGQAAILSRLPAYEEKLRLLRAITRQRTMLLRLHITPSSDIDALTRYWSKGAWDTDTRTILQSLATIPSGTWINVLMLLPPLPTEEIYSYPNIMDNPLNGPPVNRDCHWTSLNFFRDVPDPNFGKEEYVRKELTESYYPVPGDPTYGDLVLFSRPDGTIIHSAVYIADEICFTKDGGSASQPWMLSTISDLVEEYATLIAPDQRLSVVYYRNKRL